MYAYQLAVSVDDGSMAITHVLRGEDLLSSTAQQIWLMKILGYEAPHYTHVPMLIDGDGNRLSKRQQGITVRALRQDASMPRQFIPPGLCRRLVPERRRYSRAELVALCDFKKMHTEPIVITGTMK